MFPPFRAEKRSRGAERRPACGAGVSFQAMQADRSTASGSLKTHTSARFHPRLGGIPRDAAEAFLST